MSFNTVYDGVRTRVTTLFPTKTIIPYPITIESNDEQFLRNGWNMYPGATSNSELSTDYSHAVDQSIIIVLSTEHLSTESNPEPFHSAIKSLNSDIELLKNSLLDLDKLGDIMKSGEQIAYVSNTQPQTVGDDSGRFIYVEVTFNFDITQQINT